DAALAELSRALERRPDQPRLYHTRAQLHLERGDRPAARRDLERAVAGGVPAREETWLASAYVELGYLKHRAGQYDDALADFDHALTVVKDYAPAHRQRAETLLALNRHDEATSALDACLAASRNPSSAVHRARGLLYAAQGDYSRAIDDYHTAL